LKSGTVFKWHLSISFSEEMVGLFDFLFVRRSFLGVRHSKNIKKSDIKILGIIPYFCVVSSVFITGPAHENGFDLSTAVFYAESNV